jgi:hypothetical protein
MRHWGTAGGAARPTGMIPTTGHRRHQRRFVSRNILIASATC